MKFLNRYSKTKNVVEINEEPSLTDQSYKDECDLGFIVESYLNKGIPLPTSTMNFYDCTSVQQFEEAMQVVAEAKTNFEQLPSKERDRFQTVENYLAFISEKSNLKECYEKGYIDPSSVDLMDVYPERYAQTTEEEKTLNTEPVNDVSVPPQTTGEDNG